MPSHTSLQASRTPRAARPVPTILVVDDEPHVRAAATRVLESCGYEVEQAADGVEALGVFSKRFGRISLVLSDVLMWRTSGAELWACLGFLYPETRILFMSGHGESELRRDGLLPTGVEFVAKPFEFDVLVERVRAVLAD
jgi:DNA-binding response OmpR family regulator